MATPADVTEKPVIKLPEATQHPRPQALAALLLYAAASFASFGSRVVGDFSHSYMAGSSPDPQLMVWSMAYWPHALSRLGDPLFTHVVWAPFGYNLAWATTVPLASVAMWPVTALFGPISSFNVLAIAAPALAAWMAFLLCREVTHRFVPSLVGGYFFGFSSYMLAHLRGGHLNLVLVFLVPLFPLLALRRLRGQISSRRFLAATAAALIAQFLVSIEVFATVVFFGAVALTLAWGFDRAGLRPALVDVARGAALAVALCAVVVSPFLFDAFARPAPVLTSDLIKGGTDALNLFVPTRVTWLGGDRFASISEPFWGQIAGQAAYLGVVLIAIVIMFAVRARGTFPGRFLAAFVAIAAVLSFGTVLHVGGHSSIPMPWIVATPVPLLNRAVPNRFMLYCFLAVAVVVALVIAWAGRETPSRRAVAWALVVLAGISLAPARHYWDWGYTPTRPPFFADGMYRGYLGPDDVVAFFGPGQAALPMVWHAESGLAFRMANAYTGGHPADLPDSRLTNVLAQSGCPPAEVSPALRSFLADTGTTVVIVFENRGRECGSLQLGTTPLRVGGVDLYRLTG